MNTYGLGRQGQIGWQGRQCIPMLWISKWSSWLKVWKKYQTAYQGWQGIIRQGQWFWNWYCTSISVSSTTSCKARVDATRQQKTMIKLFIFALISSILQQDERECDTQFVWHLVFIPKNYSYWKKFSDGMFNLPNKSISEVDNHLNMYQKWYFINWISIIFYNWY